MYTLNRFQHLHCQILSLHLFVSRPCTKMCVSTSRLTLDSTALNWWWKLLSASDESTDVNEEVKKKEEEEGGREGVPGDLKHEYGKLGIWLAGDLKVQVASVSSWYLGVHKPNFYTRVKCLSNWLRMGTFISTHCLFSALCVYDPPSALTGEHTHTHTPQVGGLLT